MGLPPQSVNESEATYREWPASAENTPSTASGLDSIVVFCYKGKKYAVPRPDSYQAAIKLVEEHLGASDDFSDCKIAIMGKLPRPPGYDVAEILPIAWDSVAPNVFTFNIELSRTKPQTKRDGSVPVIKLRVIKSPVSPNRDWEIFAEHTQSFGDIKSTIYNLDSGPYLDRNYAKGPSLLVIESQSNTSPYFRSFVTPKDSETLGQYNLQNDDIIHYS